MNKFLIFLIHFIAICITDFIFFVVTAKIKGKQCGYDCSKCTNWACTHDGLYEGHSYYPVRDWSRFCKGVKK